MARDLSLTRQVQLLQVDILNEFKRICEKYGLRYFAIGGTCIGAIRHAGFIPWDDDIDVAMPHADYEKFRAVAKNELTAPFELYDPHDHVSANINFLKVHNANTAFIEDGVVPFPDGYKGVFIDVMPIYGLPKGKWKTRYLLEWHGLALRKNGYVRIPSIETKDPFSKIVFLTTGSVRKKGNYNHYLKKLEDRFRKYSFEGAEQIFFGWRTMEFWKIKARYKRMVFPARLFADFKEVPFESTTIRVPIGYDEYLTQDFGDYMQLPPEEERFIHSTAVIDLEKSFREYAGKLG